MQYKALMLDIDGTTIPYAYDALPSDKVKSAISKARKKGVNICLVTGRSYPATKRILEYLDLTDSLAVVDGGAMVVDTSTDKLLYERYIPKKDVETIIEVFEDENVDLFVKDKNSLMNQRDRYEPYKRGVELLDVSMFFTDEVFTLDQTHAIMKKLSRPDISLFRTHHKTPNKFSFNITHIQATKMHGIHIIMDKYKLKSSEIIGVGDGYNDFPLLMSCGLKVAMGNAIDDLKAIADYTAPTVENDGVADVIEKYFLSI